MESSGYAKSFRDLIVYQKSRQVSRTAFKLSKAFPKDEAFSLTSQLRRSSWSIGAQITEAWAKRRYQAHFISKLTDADAEQQETQHWVEIAEECEYLSSEGSKELLYDLLQIGRMLNSMIEKANQFCGSSPSYVREDRSGYFIEERNPRFHATAVQTDH